jgi:hypothetical protein
MRWYGDERWLAGQIRSMVAGPFYRESRTMTADVIRRRVVALLLGTTISGGVSPAAAQLSPPARPEYTILRAGTPIVVDGRLDEVAWIAAKDVGEFVFPWHESGRKERTIAKLLWDDEFLYLAFICEDAHIWAVHTERDSRVWLDDTVELFTAPDPSRPNSYYNFEMNAIGIYLDQFQPDGPGTRGYLEWSTDGIQVKTSIVGTLNDDSDEDSYWVLEAAIPFTAFAEGAHTIPPLPGDVWHVNLNRLGGNTNPQQSQWSASQTPRPSFHVPADFGRMTFSDLSSPF